MVGIITKSDLEEISKLCKTLGYRHSPQQLAARIKRLPKQPNHFFKVERLNGHVVGFVHAEIRDSVHTASQIEIEAIVTNPLVQGLGHGTALIQAVKTWAKTKHIKTIYLRSNVKRLEAHAFYLSLGFKNIKTAYIFERKA